MTDRESTYSLVKRGVALLDGGNPAQAALVLEKARVAEPGKGSILELLGRAYYSSGRHDAAAAVFEEAIEVDPVNDYAHYCLGLCYLKLRRKPEAAGQFKVAWALKPLDIYRSKAERFGAVATESTTGGPG
jgi:tetratricopeptide (TPR) repeat protein